MKLTLTLQHVDQVRIETEVPPDLVHELLAQLRLSTNGAQPAPHVHHWLLSSPKDGLVHQRCTGCPATLDVPADPEPHAHGASPAMPRRPGRPRKDGTSHA